MQKKPGNTGSKPKPASKPSSRASQMKQIKEYLATQQLSPEEQKIGEILAKGQNISAQDQVALDQAAAIVSAKAQVKANLEEQERLKQEQLAEEKRQTALKRAGLAAQAEDIVNKQRLISVATTAYSNAHDQIIGTSNKVTDATKSLWGSIGSVTTPGSIWLPITILMLFYFIVFPVNGHPRIEWLFLAMTGQAQIQGVTS